MTSLLPPPSRAGSGTREDDTGRDRRPVAVVGTLGGLAAALVPLGVCLVLGVVGWFLSDGGTHGEPIDGVRIGALGWLTAHGSGVTVAGSTITALPLGLLLLCAFVTWRCGLSVGLAVWDRGPDAEGVGDGQRDLVVPAAAAVFAAGYVLVGVLTATLAATPDTDPDAASVVLWSLGVAGLAGGAGIAVGAGRAAVWIDRLPLAVRAVLDVARRTLTTFGVVSLLGFLAALIVDFPTAANVMTQLGGGIGGFVVVLLLSLALLPNAVLFSSAYLLGPGFAIGTGTVVAPALVSLGPLPAFPMLAALPDDGVGPGWTQWLVVLAPLTAVYATARSQWHRPATGFFDGVLRGLAGGVLSGVLLAVAASFAGGAVGPGRMQDVAPAAFDMLLHGVAAFGVGGILAGLVLTWWQRRGLEPDAAE